MYCKRSWVSSLRKIKWILQSLNVYISVKTYHCTERGTLLASYHGLPQVLDQLFDWKQTISFAWLIDKNVIDTYFWSLNVIDNIFIGYLYSVLFLITIWIIILEQLCNHYETQMLNTISIKLMNVTKPNYVAYRYCFNDRLN